MTYNAVVILKVTTRKREHSCFIAVGKRALCRHHWRFICSTWIRISSQSMHRRSNKVRTSTEASPESSMTFQRRYVSVIKVGYTRAGRPRFVHSARDCLADLWHLFNANLTEPIGLTSGRNSWSSTDSRWTSSTFLTYNSQYVSKRNITNRCLSALDIKNQLFPPKSLQSFCLAT